MNSHHPVPGRVSKVDPPEAGEQAAEEETHSPCILARVESRSRAAPPRRRRRRKKKKKKEEEEKKEEKKVSIPWSPGACGL